MCRTSFQFFYGLMLMKEMGMLHVQRGFVIIYPLREVVRNFILIEKIARNKSIL